MNVPTAPIEYTARRDRNRAIAQAAEALGRRLSLARLVVFFVVVGAGVAAAKDVLPWLAVVLLAVAFVVLVVVHQRARRRQWEAERLALLYEKGLARLADEWAGTGDDGLAYRPEDHVFADDLDLFGKGSLFELLCTARSGAGKACLARWLLEPAAADEVRGRQEAIAELAPNVDLREQIAVLGGEIRSALDRGEAAPWGRADARLQGKLVPWVARILGLASATLMVGWSFAGWPLLPLVASLALQFLWTLPWWGRVGTVLQEAEHPTQDLALTGLLLRLLEEPAYASPWLRGLQAELEAGARPPSEAIRRITRLADFVEARRNQVFLPISWLLCLGTQLAYAIEAWRREYGPELGRWSDALGAFEAAVSLSGYAYEHPADPFPELVTDGSLFAGEALGHPLLPEATCVRNDVRLEAPPTAEVVQAFLVSGSNMSGKSTLLRTVGVNTVLAWAGAPVRATSLSLSPLVVGASIRIHDSLQAGASRFYAEIARLRSIVDLTRGDRPTIFLLDEILHGTNSHDRRIGAEAVIRSLLEVGAIGLVTTHDLALAEIADRDPRMANVHFEDRLVDGKMHFDYRLHPGVVTHSNAIALMRSVGLDVQEKP